MPKARINGELEQALQQTEPGSPLQQNLSDLLNEVRRLSADADADDRSNHRSN